MSFQINRTALLPLLSDIQSIWVPFTALECLLTKTVVTNPPDLKISINGLKLKNTTSMPRCLPDAKSSKVLHEWPRLKKSVTFSLCWLIVALAQLLYSRTLNRSELRGVFDLNLATTDTTSTSTTNKQTVVCYHGRDAF